MNLGVPMSLPLRSNLPAAAGPNGVLSGDRSAAGMVSRNLTDTIKQEWNPTTGNFLVTGKLLHLEGADRDIDLSWRYNSINDDRPTLSEGTAETALTVGADNSVTYTAADGGTYTFVPKTGGGWTMPAGLNATITAFSASAVTLRFNDTGYTNFYAKVGTVFRLAYAGDQYSAAADRIAYAYDTDGRLSTITTATGRQVLFEYNDADNTGQASKITDQTLNRVITIDYGSDGKMRTITDATGTTTGLDYTNGKLTRLTDGMGTRNELAYDANGKAAKITYASADNGVMGPVTWKLNAVKAAGAWRTALKPAGTGLIGLRTSSTASNDTATTTVSIPAPTGRAAGDVLVASFTADFDPTAAVPAGWTAIVNGLGINSSSTSGARVFTYYHVAGASEPANYTWTLSKAVKWGGGINAYTGVDNTTPLDSTVVTAVDATYAATSITVGSITTASTGALLIGGLGFDSSNPAANPPSGWVQRWETSGGQVTEMADRIQDPAQSTTHTLAAVDATTSTLTDSAGAVTTYKFNATRQVTTVTDALGHVTTDSYDTHDNRVSRLDHLSNLSTAAYNPNNTLNNTTAPAGVTGGNGTKLSYTYPAATAGEAWLEYQPTSYTDSEGQITNYTYDSTLGRPYQTVTPGGAAGAGTKTSRYQGDAAGTTCGALRGQLCKTIDGNGNTTTITYDANRNPATITPPAPLGATTMTFDAAGRVATRTDGKNQTATYSYDGNDRLTQTRYGPTCVAATCITYTYDANGNTKTRVDGSGTTTYAYDVQNRPTAKTIGGTTTSLTFDKESNVTSFTDPAGTVTYRYDEINRLMDLAEPGGSCAIKKFPNSTKCTMFSYDNNNRRVGTSYPTGVENYTVYDNAGRITSITTTDNFSPTVLSKRTYTYTTNGTSPVRDGALRKTMTTETGAVTTYGYDAVKRLTSATTGSTTDSWTYDANGNRLTAAKTGTATDYYAYNAADQMCWYASTPGTCASPPAGATTYTYDANGNTTAAGTTGTQAYNVFDQFTSNTNGTTTTNYTYAGQSNTERMTAGATSFLNGSLGVTQQTKTSGTTSFTRDPDGNLISMRDSAGASYYYTTDALGSVILLTDSNQAKVATYGYDSWGEATSTTGTLAATNPWGYAGGYKDTTSNRIKFGARYYNSARGRFTQPDPSAQETNRYLYAAADAVNNSDSSGLLFGDSGYGCAPYNTPDCAGITGGSYPQGTINSCGFGFFSASIMMMLPGPGWVGLVGYGGALAGCFIRP